MSRAPLAKLQAYKRRMGWTFPWASSFGSDFNYDFNVWFTEEQQREGGIEYNYRREPPDVRRQTAATARAAVAEIAAMTGTDAATYTRERPGMSAFALEDGVVYHTYSAYARGLDGLWGMYQWLDRAPKGRNETGLWWRRHDEYEQRAEPTTPMSSERASQRAFLGVSALLFAASAAVTIAWCASMSAMGEMPMPGGWTMSMAWMRMPGQTWPGAAASFLGMWVVMMVAMMLPSLVPMLWRYREAVGRTGETRLGRLTALVGVGYFFVWTVLGVAAFPLGVALAAVEMQQPALARAVPIAVGVVVLMAGALQLTAWKARHLACCREAPGRGRTLPADAGTAWRHGLRLGLHCSHCCAGLTAVLLVVGVMDLRAMAVVAAAITVERLAPAGERVARATGAVVVGAGLLADRASGRARMTRIRPRRGDPC